ncbi:MAG: hypothetical protein JXQ72_05435 [Anaerolineae bacterium]|nr:hypothetical protein [Anaerolineae bacterium]
MPLLKKLALNVIVTVVIWLSLVAAMWLVDGGEIVRIGGAILALISTMTLWVMWAMVELGIDMDSSSSANRLAAANSPARVYHEKPKRDSGEAEDARVSLLLAMLTPDERDSIRSRLVDDLSTDGESLSLADLIAQQEQDSRDAGHSAP